MSPQGRARPARDRDLDRAAALFSLLLEHHPGDRFALRSGAESRLRDWLAGRLQAGTSRVLVFEAGAGADPSPDAGPEPVGDLLGLCVASRRVRPAIFRETERGEIEHLVVRPDARRRGVGGALVEAALAWLRAQAVERVEIQVDRANEEGRAFWRALGFEAVVDVLERPL